MKKTKFLFATVIILFLLTSCNREPDLPVVLFNELEKGSFPRLLNLDGIFDNTNVEDSYVSWEVEFYDEDLGARVSEYSWQVSFKKKYGTGNQPKVDLITIPKDSFQINSNSGLPSISQTWSFQKIIDSLDLTSDSIKEGDQFIFFATLKRDDGKVFSLPNTGDNILTSSSFSGFFTFTMDVVCSFDLSGLMDVSTVGWCGDTWTGQLNLVKLGNDSYGIAEGQFDLGAYLVCYGLNSTPPCDPNDMTSCNLRWQQSCIKLSFTGASRWGEMYYINSLTINGPELTIDWYNDYNPESGVSTLTRTDGRDWPPLTL